MNINIWLPLLCIVALAMFNVPIWLALLGGALPYFLILQPTLPVQIAVQRVVAVTETSSYLAIPFFITAGAIMNYAGISSRLLDLADGLVGHLTGAWPCEHSAFRSDGRRFRLSSRRRLHGSKDSCAGNAQARLR